MPRKKNNRKAIQKAKAEAQPKPRRVGIIGHTPYGGSGVALAMAVAMAFPRRVSVDVLDKPKEGQPD